MAGECRERPRVRGECEPGGRCYVRPCPWVSCQHHLLPIVQESVNSRPAWMAAGRPLALGDLIETCVLDLADRGGMTHEDIAAVLCVSKERARQYEAGAFTAFRRGLIRGGTFRSDVRDVLHDLDASRRTEPEFEEWSSAEMHRFCHDVDRAARRLGVPLDGPRLRGRGFGREVAP